MVRQSSKPTGGDGAHGPSALRESVQSSNSRNDEYAFLTGHLDSDVLARAGRLAEAWGVAPHEVLIANDWMSAEDYTRALAQSCGLRFARAGTLSRMAPPERTTLAGCLETRVMQLSHRYHSDAVLEPSHLSPGSLSRALPELRQNGVVLASRRQLRAAIDRHFAASLVDGAVNDLRLRHPEHSAAYGTSLAQRIVVGALALALTIGLAAASGPVMGLIGVALGLVFLPVVLLRSLAAWDAIAARHETPEPARIPDRELPVYTVLAPLFQEADVAADLLEALAKFDYPAAKLDIKLILEASDAETIAAARTVRLPGNVEIVIVPDMMPRTKPKALNYALPFARGELLAIYDAEDKPEPDQLRKACAAFRAGPPNLACVQARLAYDNWRENWLTRQFAIEYTALFDGLLPTLARLDLPIPLGGTSNHFRVTALIWLCGWDPFNVTEDADLGIRLARRGYLCRTIDSTTYEEATARLAPWIRQRTRWLKGYMQTYAVHMRDPVGLWRELGPRRFIGVQAIIGGLLLSTLAHPWFYFFAAWSAWQGTLFALPATWLGWPFWVLAVVNLAAGYLASLGLGLATVWRRGHRRLVLHTVFMPVYWLMASAAAYRALCQMQTAPFLWEKTTHGVSAHRDTPPRATQSGRKTGLEADFVVRRGAPVR